MLILINPSPCYVNASYNEYSLSKGFALSADLVFVYVNHLDDDTLFLTDYYKIYNNRTAIIIKRDGIFLTEEIAHAIGHVLGAGHGHDKSKRQPLNQIPFVLVAEI